ncbi:myb-like transcription factor family protein [Striga hermonthica]|uniref:Myb-like transcription factor family protein n=1 Tax=Striga hermonthica TaxID=68872 RepID=A0A9N7N2H9_STRHE|nr:myb-like transcription factor family protein [Striga hermonthica]
MVINGLNHCLLPENMQRCRDYLQSLEEERRKIQVFRRELPLCLELVTQTIELCKQQLSETTTESNLNNGQSESPEESSSDLPVLEEFIPIKRASPHSDYDEQQQPKNSKIDDGDNVCEISGNNIGDMNIKKSDWLRSVQLWNQSPDLGSNEGSPRKDEVKKDGNKKEEKEGNSRKARRCWSNELHHKFLQALRQLGGSHLATPKQIRELMKVDGLTNDEVKSHLQKYRLHTRRPIPPVHSATINSAATQPPQFVVVAGGLWMPSEYTSAKIS